MVKQRLTDKLPSLKFLCLRFHFPCDRRSGVHLEKNLPFKIIMKNMVETHICQAAESLICSIKDKSSKLKLLIFEGRGLKTRWCFARGWSHRGPHIIPEHLVKFHIPEYEPMPEYKRPMSWKDEYESKYHLCEEWSKWICKWS